MLKQKIETMKAVSLTDERQVVDIDVDFYSELNKKLVADYVNFKNRILNSKAYKSQSSESGNNDPNRIKLDQTVPERPKSEAEMLKIPLIIMGIVVAAFIIIISWFA